MALPTSGPLSMSAIATEFEQGGSNMSLYTFGSTLPTPTVTSNIELANDFYGQSASACTEFECSGKSGRDAKGACKLEPDTTFYHNGSGNYPQEGDTVFIDSSCSTTLRSGFYKMGNGNVIVIEGNSGVVDSIESC